VIRPDLTIAKTHTGNFSPGETGATYTLTVSNVGAGATVGTVTVTDALPAGLTATAIIGTGWSCTLNTLSCTRSDALNASGSYAAITLTVNVSANVAPNITNTATVSGGGELNTANDTASDSVIVIRHPDLTIAKTHTGNFSPGETGATYTLTVSNVGNGATVGTVTVTDALPAGLTATAITGTGWACTLNTLTCTRSDVLNASGSYAAITLTVTVSVNVAPNITNTATVSGGGEINTANDTASDSVIVIRPDLTIAKTHTGNFSPGETGATYTLTASNVGAGATVGAVTVTDALPAGLTATAIIGTGWACTLDTLSCTRSDVLNAGGSYAPITLTVNVSANVAPNITNTATVSGGGEINTANDTASDPTHTSLLEPRIITKASSLSVIAGSIASLDFTVESGPAVGLISFSCSGLPIGASCSFNPASENKPTATVTMTVTTTPFSSSVVPFGGNRMTLVDAVLFPLLGLAGLGLVMKKGKQMRLAMLLTGLLVLLIFAGCGGVSRSQSTPAGTFPITVKATSPTGQASTIVNLTVL
jgi:uncharacterized repeat protein (TIGR01451 family)